MITESPSGAQRLLGGSVTLVDGGEALFSIRCNSSRGVLLTSVGEFEPLPREDDFLLLLDGEEISLTPMLDRVVEGVVAEGPLSENILALLSNAREARVVYGAQTFGPVELPAAAMATIAGACRNGFSPPP